MIPLDKLRAVTHLITHANCPDGVASALIVKDALPDVRVSFMSYDTAEHRALAAEPGLLFCDFSPPRARVQEFVAAGAICLDHHPLAKDIVEVFGELSVFGLNERGECGAWLAYEHVWLPTYLDEDGAEDDDVSLQMQQFANLAAVRDTWKRSDPKFRLACEQAEILMFWGEMLLDPLVWSRDELFEEFSPESRIYLGHHLFVKKLAAARTSLDEAYDFATNRGTRGVVFQGVTTTSDATEIADKHFFGNEPDCRFCGCFGPTEEDRPCTTPNLVVGFHYKVDAGKLTLQFSMRSHTGYDVGAFAKHHGGGGHAAAAGFTVDVSPERNANPYQVFRLLLEEWEGRDG